MIKEIILKEIYGLISSKKYLISLSVIIVLIIINSLLISRTLEKDSRNFLGKKNQNGEGLRKNSENFSDIIFFDQMLGRNSSNLSFFSSAKNEILPNGINLNYFEKSEFVDFKKKSLTNNTFSPFDWSNILIYVFSFIVIVLTYDSISGEKQNGTLKLLNTYYLKKWELLIGKFLGIFLGVSSMFILTFLINILVINFLQHIHFTNSDIIKVLLFFIASLFFISFLVIFSIFISSITYSPSKSLNILLVFWTLFTLIIPNIAWMFAKKIDPVKSYADTKNLEEVKIKEIENSDGFSYSWDTKWITPNEQVIKRSEGIKKITKAHNDIWNYYKSSLFFQTKLAINISKISPSMLFRFIGEKISDNGFYGYVNFYRQIENYQNTYQQYLTSFDSYDKDSYHLIWEEEFTSKSFISKKPIKYEEIPKFEYKTPNLSIILYDCIWEFLLLLSLTIVAFIINYFVIIKYDVR
jgi:ABC-type transport system involved in multi-copper enzyme maturation permease subunit